MFAPFGRVAFLSVAAALGCLALVPGHGHAAPTVTITANDETAFARFLQEFRKEALAAGIRARTYDRAIANIRLNPKVQELNLAQPEFVRPVWEYLQGAVSEIRVRDGREAAATHRELLSR